MGSRAAAQALAPGRVVLMADSSSGLAELGVICGAVPAAKTGIQLGNSSTAGTPSTFHDNMDNITAKSIQTRVQKWLFLLCRCRREALLCGKHACPKPSRCSGGGRQQVTGRSCCIRQGSAWQLSGTCWLCPQRCGFSSIFLKSGLIAFKMHILSPGKCASVHPVSC